MASAVVVSASITIVGLIIGYVQWRRDIRIKLDSIHDEVTKELVHQRIDPYSKFMAELEVLSRRYETALRNDRARVGQLASIFHNASFGPVGILSSNLTREIIVCARAGCINYADMKITFDEFHKRIWGVHQALRSDLGLSQPNWPNETEARRRGLLADDSEAVETLLREAVHLTYDLYDQVAIEIQLHGRPAIRGVIFDMDGLLIDTEIVERRAWQRAAQERGCSITDDEFTELVGKSAVDTRGILKRIWLGKDENADEYDNVRDLKELYVAHDVIHPKDGASEILCWANDSKLPIAVASSSQRTIVIERLRAAELIDKGIDIVVGGDEVRRGKPKPDIFELAAKRLKLDPRHCIVIEDSVPGIRAANAANMTSIMVPDTSVVTQGPTAEVLSMVYCTDMSLNGVLETLRKNTRLVEVTEPSIGETRGRRRRA